MAPHPVACTPVPADTSHPLQQGLSWKNIIWPAQPDINLSGSVLLWGDGFPLFTLAERGTWTDFHWNLADGGGQLPHHPLWPAMIWNVTSWLAEQRPGPDRYNYSCGERVSLRFPANEDTATLRLNQKSAHTIRLSQPGGLAVTAPLEAGLLTISSGNMHWTVSLNPTSMLESDLRQAKTGAWTAQPHRSAARKMLSPFCFLLALVILPMTARMT